LFFSFLIGLIILIFKFIISIDLVKKENSVKYKLLLLLWIVIPLVYFGFFVNHFEDRYIFMIFPAVFLILGYGIEKIQIFIEKFNKPLGIICILIILFYGAYQMYNQSNLLINDKLASYKDIKTAGIWIEKNSTIGDAVIAKALPMANYYTERETYPPQANLSSQLDFIEANNVKYLLISNWDRDPQWLLDYLSQDQSKFKPVYSAISDYKGQKTYAYVFSVN